MTRIFNRREHKERKDFNRETCEPRENPFGVPALAGSGLPRQSYFLLVY